MGFLSGVLGTRNEYDPNNPTEIAATQRGAPKNTFKATQAYLPKQNYGAGVDQALSNQQANYGQQQSFIDTVRARSNGQGPSVAGGMLNEATQKNIANTAGMVASNRNLSPAAAARLQIEGGAAAQGQAAGQAATLRAGEIQANTSLLGQALGQQGGQNLGVLSTVAGAEQGQNALALQNSLGTQGINAQIGGQNAGLQLGQEQLAAGINAGNAATNAAITGGVLNAAGAAAGAAKGGEITPGGVLPAEAAVIAPGEQVNVRTSAQTPKEDPIAKRRALMSVAKPPPAKMADGGVARPPVHAYLAGLHAFDGGGGVSMDTGAGLGGAETMTDLPATPADSDDSGTKRSSGPFSTRPDTSAYDRFASMHLAGSMYADGGSIYAQGGRVPALVSPQEVVVPPDVAHNPERAAEYVEKGKGKVPGKAKVKGDSPKNDFVRARLPVGAVVVPRSITQGENAGERAKSFVESVLHRSGGKRYARGGKVDLSEGGLVSGGGR